MCSLRIVFVGVISTVGDKSVPKLHSLVLSLLVVVGNRSEVEKITLVLQSPQHKLEVPAALLVGGQDLMNTVQAIIANPN